MQEQKNKLIYKAKIDMADWSISYYYHSLCDILDDRPRLLVSLLSPYILIDFTDKYILYMNIDVDSFMALDLPMLSLTADGNEQLFRDLVNLGQSYKELLIDEVTIFQIP